MHPAAACAGPTWTWVRPTVPCHRTGCARRHGNGKRVHFTRPRRRRRLGPLLVCCVTDARPRLLLASCSCSYPTHSVFVLETRPCRLDYLGSFYASRPRGCRESDGRLKGTRRHSGAPAVRCTVHATLAQADAPPGSAVTDRAREQHVRLSVQSPARPPHRTRPTATREFFLFVLAPPDRRALFNANS